MPKVNFAKESALSGDNPGVTAQRLVNCYASPTSLGARSPFVLRSVLGYDAARFGDVVNYVPVAALGGEDYLFVIASGRLFSISSLGASTLLGSVASAEDAIMARIEGGVAVASGGDYFVWDGAALTKPEGGAFTSEGSVAFLDQYTVISEEGGRRVEWTELAAPASRNASHVKIKEGRPDNVLRVLAAQGRLWVMGESSSEVWYNTGEAGALAFERVPGGVIDTGILGKTLCMDYQNAVYLVGDDKVVYRASGLSLEPISTSAVSRAIEQETPTHVFAYEDRGHKFICIRFAERPAWCFDLATGGWHERMTGVDFGGWNAVAASKSYGQSLAVTATGDIEYLSRSNADRETPLKRVMVSLPLDLEGRYLSASMAEFRIQAGLGSVDDDAGGVLDIDATATLRVSRDGGATFGPEKSAGIGRRGQYGKRVRFRGLGRSDHWTFELSVSDSAELPVESMALLEVR